MALLLSKIYFNAVFGALGGLIGWLLFSIFGDARAPEEAITRELLQGGAFIGGGIGYLVVSVEAIRDRSWLRFVRLASYGLVLGALGGAAGMFLGEWLNGLLGSTAENFVVKVLVRGLGLVILGFAVGMSEGIAARSLGRFSYGTIGGSVGGFVGGSLFAMVYLLTVRREAPASIALAGAIGCVIMGACIGSLSALVKVAFQPACVRVVRGWQEGREYALDKDNSLLGRDEHADIALFRDMKVEKRHAIIQREGLRYLLLNNHAPPEFTRVNDAPVPQVIELHDGDRIQLGNVILRFHLRAARARK